MILSKNYLQAQKKAINKKDYYANMCTIYSFNVSFYSEDIEN